MSGELPLHFLTWAVDRPGPQRPADADSERHDRILLVAREHATQDWLEQALRKDIRAEVMTANDVASALSMLQAQAYSVVLVDFSAEASAANLLRSGGGMVSQVKATDPSSEVIVITDWSKLDLSLELMKDGAFDCLIAPVRLDDVLSSVNRALRHRRLTLEERAYYELIERTVYRKERDLHTIYVELQEAYRQTLWALGSALESRDVATNAHSIRVMNYSRALGQALGLTGKTLQDIEYGVFLHDIGKIAVPDAILLKADKLTTEEWVAMRKHPAQGRYLLAGIAFLEGGIDIVYCHHERWDGEGYPRKLKGESIPFGARIFAVADTLDAMTSDRPYRKALPYNYARTEILANSGTQFDPDVVKVFREFTDVDWKRIWEESEELACAVARRKQECLKD